MFCYLFRFNIYYARLHVLKKYERTKIQWCVLIQTVMKSEEGVSLCYEDLFSYHYGTIFDLSYRPLKFNTFVKVQTK